jgi:hypothetical protein
MPSPLRRRSRGIFRSASRRGLASVHRWALPEARHGQQSTRPAPDAVPLFPPSFEHAFHAARGRVCPVGLPARLRSHPRHRPGLSVRGGPMRVDGATTQEPIHQMARGQTSPPMPKPRPRGRPASPPPMAAEMHGWAGSTRFVFKTDRVGERVRWPTNPLGRCRDVVVACGAELLDH